VSERNRSLRSFERIERKRDFRRAYENGKRIGGRLFIAYVVRRRSGPLRVGVVASRRVGCAVVRNRAKRVLREVFRNNRPSEEIAADVVLIARASIAKAGYGEIEEAYVGKVVPAVEERGKSDG